MSWNEVEEKGGNGNKTNYTKFEDKKAVVLRVMDAEPVAKWRHWIQASKRSVTCCGQGCPVCAVIKAAKEADIVSPYSSTKRFTINVLNKTTNQIELLEQGKVFFEQLLVYKTNMGDLNSFDLKIIRSGTKKGDTTYSYIPLPPTLLTKAELDMYEANKVDINESLKPYTIQQTTDLMNGMPAEEVFKNRNEGDEEIEV